MNQLTDPVKVQGTWRGGRRIDLDAFFGQVEAIKPAARPHQLTQKNLG